jgi:hypothetical protein
MSPGDRDDSEPPEDEGDHLRSLVRDPNHHGDAT